jgi:hypothetical protein
MPPKEKNGNEKLDPPAQMLLEAIIRAWSAGVPASEAVPLLKLSLSAKGFKAPVWRSAADALSEAAETAEKEKAGLEAGTAS